MSYRKIVKNFDREWLHDQYVIQGKSTRQIAGELGVGRQTVCDWLRKAEIELRKSQFQTGHAVNDGKTPWNKGLTAETDPILAATAEKRRIIDGLTATQRHELRFPEKCKARKRKRYDDHREEVLQYSKEYRAKRPHRTWASGVVANHKVRGIQIDISLDDLTTLAEATKECRYCHKTLNWSSDGSKNSRISDDSPTIDVLDNEKYVNSIWQGDRNTSDTITICCHDCNTSKHNRTFIEWIVFSKNLLSCLTRWKDVVVISNRIIRNWASKRLTDHRMKGYKVEMSLNALMATTTETCRYCGCDLDWSRGTKQHRVQSNSPSIDRVDNDMHLDHVWQGDDKTFGAVTICCNKCNTCKSNRTFAEWLALSKSLVDEFSHLL
jgi:transposase